MILEIHARLGNTTFYYAALMSLWAIWKIIRKEKVDSSFWGALIIAEILIIAQGILGLYLYFFSDILLARKIHILYGALSALAIPAAYIISRGHHEQRDMIIYGATFIVMAVLTARALQTAGQLLIFE